MHFLCAPTDAPVHGFTRAVITTVMALAASPTRPTRRVVVEPDVRNTAVHALNAAVGFGVVGTDRASREKDAPAQRLHPRAVPRLPPAATADGPSRDHA